MKKSSIWTEHWKLSHSIYRRDCAIGLHFFRKLVPLSPSAMKLEKNQSCKNPSFNTKMHSSAVSKIEKVKVAARQMMKIAILINWFFSSFIPDGGYGLGMHQFQSPTGYQSDRSSSLTGTQSDWVTGPTGAQSRLGLPYFKIHKFILAVQSRSTLLS